MQRKSDVYAKAIGTFAKPTPMHFPNDWPPVACPLLPAGASSVLQNRRAKRKSPEKFDCESPNANKKLRK